MRIISQNGTIDIPYELAVLWCDNFGNIQCKVNSESLRLAMYPTKERAKEVLKDIMNAYRNDSSHYILPLKQEVNDEKTE